jgi:hypothetical protein
MLSFDRKNLGSNKRGWEIAPFIFQDQRILAEQTLTCLALLWRTSWRCDESQ